MSNELKTYLGIYSRGNAAEGVGKIEKALGRLGSRGEAHLSRLGRSLNAASKTLDRIGNRYTAIFSGAAATGAVKQVADLDTRLTYLGIQTGKSKDEMDKLKKKIFEVANDPSIRISPDQLLNGIDQIVEKTGDLPLATNNLRNIGLAIRAANAEGAFVGAWVSNLSEKFGIRDSEAVLAAIDHSINAGKEGSFTFANLASQGERITAAYAAMGRTGPKAAAELDAMMQMIKKGVGGPEQATTAFEAYLRTLNDASKVKKIKAAGIKLQDAEGTRSAIEIMKDFITASKGDVTKLSTIFDAEAMRAFNAAITEYKQTGGFAGFDKFLNSASDGQTLLKDAAQGASTFGAALQSLDTNWRKFADENLSEPVQDLADALNSFEPEKVQSTMKALAWGAGIIGGLVIASKVNNALNSFGVGLPFGSTKKRGVAGNGVTPVIVTNWPGGMSQNGAWGKRKPRFGRNLSGRTGRLSSLANLAGRAGRFLGRGGGLLTAASGVVDAGFALASGNIRGAVGAGGRTGGALAGAALGASIGSIVPVVGTALGGILGSVVGAMGGETLSKSAYDQLSETNDPVKQSGHGMRGELDITISAPDGNKVRVTRVKAENLDLQVGHTNVGVM